LRIVAAVFLVIGLLLGGRAVHIGLSDGDRYGAYASEIGVEHVAAAGATRGSIVSADGRELAKSLETASVVATPYLIEDPESARSNSKPFWARRLDPKRGRYWDHSPPEALPENRPVTARSPQTYRQRPPAR
jgi:cell division protein FtsI/penicillin-binding protein 2